MNKSDKVTSPALQIGKIWVAVVKVEKFVFLHVKQSVVSIYLSSIRMFEQRLILKVNLVFFCNFARSKSGLA